MSKALLLSHTEFSKRFHHGGLGEIVNSAKLSLLMKEMDHKVDPIVDIYALFGEPHDQTYRDLYRLNLDLAELGHPLLEQCELERAKQIFQQVKGCAPETIFILSWFTSLATLFATGIQKICPIVSKSYVFNESHGILPSLYTPSDLLITENLLANRKGIESGIPAWKMIYLPHHFPKQIETVKPDSHYLKRVAFANNKPLKCSNHTVVIGMVSRLAFRKNCSYVFEAISTLAEQGRDVLLVVKGNFEKGEVRLQESLANYLNEPWFLWDKSYTPFPEILSEYRTFDLFVNLSGREGASNVVVEMLSLGIPTVVLEGTTNPYLFRGGAIFCRNDGEIHLSQRLFQAPDRDALLETLKALVDNTVLRQEWQARAKAVAYQRFHPEITLKRLPLIFETAHAYRRGERGIRKKVEALYKADCDLYGFK